MILIIGSEEEYHSKYIYDLLMSKNQDVCYLDTRRIPKDLLISWSPSYENIQGVLNIDNKKINLSDIKSVYWRWHYGISIPPEENTEEGYYMSNIIEREVSSNLNSLFQSLDCLWVNSFDAIEMHKNKGYQLNLMAKNNIRIPKTFITNDKEELLSYIDDTAHDLVCKPVRGGAHTEKITKEDLTDERLNSLKLSPVKFQEYIEGTDVRVYVIGDKIFAANILADTVDFREDEGAKIEPIEIPDNIKQDCLKIMKLFKLNFSGIDIKHSAKTGEYVFIEANPSPMFTYFEQESGYPISEALCELLIKGKQE